jgi:CRP-like cAMP-binding protein
MSATDYLAQGDSDGALESLENIHLGKKLAQPDFNPFDEYRKAQKDWVEVVSAIKDNRYELRKLMEANNMTQSSIVRNEAHVRAVSLEDVASEAAKHEIFSVYTPEEMIKVAKIAKILTYYENERVFSAGDLNDCISYILKGKVSLNIPGDEIGVAVLEKGALVGESCMVHKTFRTNCTAREFTEFLVVPLDKLTELEKEDPVFAAKFMKMIVAQMSKKISDSNNRIREIMNVSQGNIDEVAY